MAEYIEREALKEVVTNLRFGNHLNKEAALKLMDRAIDNLPAADVAPVVHGRWVKEADYSCCSCCGQAVADECVLWFKYCPNCGAKVDAEE